MTDKKIIFLGGTCNGSKWRDHFIRLLKIDYFNPVVEDWTEECQKKEIEMRKTCDYILYVITPKMEGAYSIAELVDDSNKRPEKTIFCFVKEDEKKTFSESQIKSLKMVEKMVRENGAKTFLGFIPLIKFLNNEI